MNYYVIFTNEEGVLVEKVTRYTLENRLNNNYYGKDMKATHIRGDMNANPSTWGTKLVIIEGEEVFPVAESVVKTWKMK